MMPKVRLHIAMCKQTYKTTSAVPEGIVDIISLHIPLEENCRAPRRIVDTVSVRPTYPTQERLFPQENASV